MSLKLCSLFLLFMKSLHSWNIYISFRWIHFLKITLNLSLWTFLRHEEAATTPVTRTHLCQVDLTFTHITSFVPHSVPEQWLFQLNWGNEAQRSQTTCPRSLSSEGQSWGSRPGLLPPYLPFLSHHSTCFGILLNLVELGGLHWTYNYQIIIASSHIAFAERQILFWALCTHEFISFSQQASEVGSLIIPILLMKELRHMEIKQCDQDHTANERQS